MAEKGREIILISVQAYLDVRIYPILQGFFVSKYMVPVHCILSSLETVVIVKIDKGLARMLAKLAPDLHLFTLDCKGLRFSE